MNATDDAIKTMDAAIREINALRAQNAKLVAALEGIIKANDDFRSQLPKDWDGDLVSDACERARAALAAAGHKP